MSNFHHDELGSTPLFACQYDRRFSYCLYVPDNFGASSAQDYALAVIVHGSGRDALKYRDCFVEFAEKNKCIVLAPLFPCRVCDENDLSSYKFLIWDGLRFDQVLLAMVQEVADKYGIDARRFLLFGFSGGGQFVHRFFYVHPERVMALSIGAPGVVTLPDETRDWYVGVKNQEALSGVPMQTEGMKDVPVHTVIGEDDTENWEITIPQDSRYWMDGINNSGHNRHDRLASLRKGLQELGVTVRHDVVKGVGHYGYDVLEPVYDFFEEALKASRGEQQDD
ncbi:MAG: alpha/beta hydrolase [Kordiimonas sp.]